MEEYTENYTVYAKLDAEGKVTAINSSAFLEDTTGWTLIDEGTGDRFHHAQGNYLDEGVRDENGCFNYKFANGILSERTLEEKQADIVARPPQPPTEEERLASTEAAILALMEVLGSV